MNTELSKLLDKLGVKLTFKELHAIPARCLPGEVRAWRVTLMRKVGRGEERRELKLSNIIMFQSTEPPTVYDVVDCLLTDTKCGEATLWDFEQSSYSSKGARSKEETERAHKACKKVSGRLRRWFGDSWDALRRADQGLTPEKGKLRKTG